MTEFQINNHILNKCADAIAADAFLEAREYGDGSEEEMRDHIWQSCDGHELVIYNYKALQTVANCDCSDGEAFLEEMGMPDDVTIYKLASIIVMGELMARANEALDGMLKSEENAA